jgi:predicted enzyme related to lactoylglutathione lyase
MTTPQFATGEPSWVDIGTTDVKGAIDFYTALFGWTHLDFGPEAGGYGVFLRDGKRVAGIGPATDPGRGTSWSTYLATADADATAARVEGAGGNVIMSPGEVMDQGRMAVFTDPAGAFFSVWQAGAHKGTEVRGEHGSLTWAELMTTDLDAAKAFYTKVFGVTARDADAGDGGTYTLIEAGGDPVAGAMQIRPDWGPMPAHWSVYFAVDDCDATADRAIELGATEMMRMDSPAGRFASLSDPQGGSFSIIRNDPNFSM